VSRSTAVTLLKYLVAVALLGLMIALNWTKLKELFRQPPHVLPFLGAAAIMAGCTALQYYRWYLLVRAVDLPFTLRNAVRLGLVGTFYNVFLPGSIGGDIVKAVFIARGQPGRKAVAVATVVFDRLVGLFGLIALAATAGGLFWLAGDEKIVNSPRLQTVVLCCLAAAGAAVAGFVLLGFVSDASAARVASRLGRLPKGATLAELWFTVVTYRRRPGTAAAVVGLSAVVHVGFVLMFHLAVRVFPPKDLALLGTLPEHFVICPIGFIVQAVIPLPGGIGGGEFTFGGLYKLIRGADGEAVGLAGRLALRVVEWTLGLVGYVAFLRMRHELPAAAEKGGGAGGAGE
jgi:uncharacterized membrane protein YbhN (UPF0104 family)